MVKNPPANTGDERDAGLIPGFRRSPGGGNGNPLQYSCLENSMDRGAWCATVHGVRKSQAWPSTHAHTHTHTHTHMSGSLLGDLHVSSRVLLELTLVPSVCQAPFTDCSFRFLNNLFYKQKSKVRVDLLAFICSCFSHVFQYWAGWWFFSSSRPISPIPTEAHFGPHWEGWQARWKVWPSGQKSAQRES